MKIIRRLFSDHYKHSLDNFRKILGLYFDLKDGRLYPHSFPKKNIYIGSDFQFSDPVIVDEDKGLFRQRVVFRPRNTEANILYLQSFFDISTDPLVPETAGTVQSVINDTLSNKNNRIYKDINTLTFKIKNEINNNSNFFSRIESKYNFYIEKYEQQIQKDLVPEEVLPNFYVVNLILDRNLLNTIVQSDFDNSALGNENTSAYQDVFNRFDKYITLDGNILLNRDQIDFFFAAALLLYCQRYAETYDNVSVDFIETARKKFSQVFTNITNKELLNKLNDFKTSYPMYIELQWTTPSLSPLLKFLEDAGIEINSLQNFINSKIISIESGEAKNLVDFYDVKESETDLTEERKNLFLFEAGDWINQYLYNLIQDLSDDGATNSIVETNNGSTLINMSNNSFTLESENDSKIEESIPLTQLLNTIIAKPKFDELVLQNTRNYRQIIEGELAKSEILFYRIEKRFNGNVLQNFYIPNIPGIDIQTYVDTQVKYNKEYTYKIYAYTIIYGTEYYYEKENLAPPPTDFEIDPTPPPLADAPSEFDIIDGYSNNSPAAPTAFQIPQQDINIIQPNQLPINFGSRGVAVFDINQISIQDPVSTNNNPEIITAPMTVIDAISGQSLSDIYLDKIEFDVLFYPSVKLVEIDYTELLTDSVLDFPPTPPVVEFFPIKDSRKKFKISLSPSSGEIQQVPIKIKSEDSIMFNSLLQKQKNGDKIIFKYEGEIKKYEMFRIENEPSSFYSFSQDETLNHKIFEGIENFLFDEFVEANKTYYYIFRTYDFHNKFSNPSPIYKVKLFENDGVEFLDVTVHEIKEAEKKFSKSFKRFIRIDTSFEQKEFSTLNQNLGLNKESVYNEEFVLRVKSKHTGKIIDINFVFNKDN